MISYYFITLKILVAIFITYINYQNSSGDYELVTGFSRFGVALWLCARVKYRSELQPNIIFRS